jgi:hypothetical protein
MLDTTTMEVRHNRSPKQTFEIYFSTIFYNEKSAQYPVMFCDGIQFECEQGQILTFRGPYIVIYSYNRSNEMH